MGELDRWNKANKEVLCALKVLATGALAIGGFAVGTLMNPKSSDDKIVGKIGPYIITKDQDKK